MQHDTRPLCVWHQPGTCNHHRERSHESWPPAYDYHLSHLDLANEVLALGAGLHVERETLGVANHRVLGIRESLRMKDELRRHGLPRAHHGLLRSWEVAEALIAEIGLPVVVKPPARSNGEGGWRVRTNDELRGALSALHASPESPALAEEMLVGRELSFDGPYDRCYAVGCAYLRGVGRGRVHRDVGIAVRNPDTEVVLAAMRTITETIAIGYGG